MRLNKFLARVGIASRRKCDELIKSGKVKINGKIETNFSFQVKNSDVIICDGKPINEIPNIEVYLLNKLKGYISTSNDPHGRKCVIDLIPSSNRLFTIGRLDRDTTGAILVTNDGELANKLMHPRNKIERVYIVTTKVDIPKSKYQMLKKGLKLNDGLLAYGDLTRLYNKAGLIYWEIVLREGRNHEVKRIFKALNSKVINLHRFSFAGLNVNNLLPGKYKKLKKRDVIKLSEKYFK